MAELEAKPRTMSQKRAPKSIKQQKSAPKQQSNMKDTTKGVKIKQKLQICS